MAFSRHINSISFGRQVVEDRFSQAIFMIIVSMNFGEAQFLLVLLPVALAFITIA